MTRLVVHVHVDEVMAQIHLACGPIASSRWCRARPLTSWTCDRARPATAVVKSTVVVVERTWLARLSHADQ
jgi:hypothetical protein